jgi:Ca2+-binding EF-hand superfamily protein
MQRAVWQEESEVFGDEPVPHNFKRDKAPWESLSKTSVDLRAEASAYERMANHEVKHLWAPPSEVDLEAAFERELAAADYEMAPPWNKSENNVIKQSSRDSQMAENYNYKAMWHDSGMSQHRLDQLAGYEMQTPWMRDGGDENKLKDLQSTKVKMPPTLAPWKHGAQPGKPQRAKKDRAPTNLWDDMTSKKKGDQKKNALPSSGDPILDALRDKILNNPNFIGVSSLARKFKIMDDDRSGALNFTEFRKGVKECRLEVSDMQIKHLFNIFDKDDNGTVTYEEFLVGIRGFLSERRKYMVGLAFQVLDADKSGVIDMEDIKKRYNASGHREVVAGYKTEEQVLRELLDSFDGGDQAAITTRDGKVTLPEFFSYYANISSGVDSDDYFELMMRNAWHLSGGEGWCSNTTNKRVLVTHTDGSQTVEEVKDDIGLAQNDVAGMAARLAKQGIDVGSLDTHGGVGGANVGADIPGTAFMQPATSAEEQQQQQYQAAPPAAAGRSSAPGSRRHSGASDKSNFSAPGHLPSPRKASNNNNSNRPVPGMQYAELAVNAAARSRAQQQQGAPQSLGDAMQQMRVAPVAEPSIAMEPSMVSAAPSNVMAGSGAAVARRKVGAVAPQYTKAMMAQAAQRGRVPPPPTNNAAAFAAEEVAAPALGSARGNRASSLREVVAKNAAEYMLDGKS